MIERGANGDARGFGERFDLGEFGGGALHDERHYVQECSVRQGAIQRRDFAAMRHSSATMIDEMEAVRAFLREALEVSGLSPYALAKKANVSATTITRPLNDPSHKFVPKASTLARIGEAAGIVPPATAPQPIIRAVRNVNVLGTIQAGAWTRIPDEPKIEYMISLSVPGFESVELFALKVIGRSMDEFYADGSYVVCASPVDMGLADGDHVAVRHYDGAFAETTLKEVAIGRDGAVTLIPRTTDSALRTSLSYQRGDDLNQTGIEIIGIVVASYNLRARGRRVA